ncbi:hypothetical protein ACWGH4_00660 [Streptomyces sp. NPDC054847]
MQDVFGPILAARADGYVGLVDLWMQAGALERIGDGHGLVARPWCAGARNQSEDEVSFVPSLASQVVITRDEAPALGGMNQAA